MSDLKDPRVLFAAERTLLAWNRTSLSFIAFGFLIERAGLLLHALAPEAVGAINAVLAFWIGILFILLGAFAAVWSSRQFRALLRTLSPAEFPAGYGFRWGLVINLIVAFLGTVLVAALFVGRV
ncbi:YidH family protein [Marinobacter sp.]|uniref:YidH family protein n=1 Tax=Marinobacter sp. TaxID=50741 RepID=UPI0034A45E41